MSILSIVYLVVIIPTLLLYRTLHKAKLEEEGTRVGKENKEEDWKEVEEGVVESDGYDVAVSSIKCISTWTKYKKGRRG